MTREETLELMAKSIGQHLSMADRLLVAQAALEHTERFTAAINIALQRTHTPESWAAFALQTAKRLLAGDVS